MKRYIHLKAKARFLREHHGKTLDEITVMLAMSKSTVYYWIRDLPLPYERVLEGRRRAAHTGSRGMYRKHAKLRRDAYSTGSMMINELSNSPTFRDFITMYIAEGYKKNRNTVNICNSDPQVIRLCYKWMREFANPERQIKFVLWYFDDQDVVSLAGIWAEQLDIDPKRIVPRPKKDSGKLARRNWRSKYGVMSITVNDTYLRSKIDAWIDWIKGQW